MVKVKLVGALILGWALMVSGAGAQEFSAEVHLEDKQGGTSVQKMFYAQDRWRTEIPAEERSIIIVRLDKKVVWMLMPAERTYMEMAMANEYLKATGKVEAKREYLGPDRVEGRATKKYRVTYNDLGESRIYYEWDDDNLKFPIKIQDEESTIIYRNIRTGRQDSSLFEVPKGYKKMAMPAMPDMRGKSPEEMQEEMEKMMKTSPPTEKEED